VAQNRDQKRYLGTEKKKFSFYTSSDNVSSKSRVVESCFSRKNGYCYRNLL